ncbi:MAG: 30S ribosomal protein S2 [Armatimonadota bacterium]
MAVVTMKELLEAGVHFGHQTRRWNPKMRGYIYHERNGIYIIDLHQTLRLMDEAYDFLRDLAAEGGEVLFVCTKRQGAESVEEAAERCGMPYVNKRWLGGMLTNFKTIKKRIDYLDELDRQEEAGEWDRLPKKEALLLSRERDKLEHNLGGIREMDGPPDALFIVDLNREQIAAAEAQNLGIPIVAMVDTNVDPTGIDFVIPSNDDAIRAIRLLTNKVADAIVEGQEMYQQALTEKAAAADQKAASQKQRQRAAETGAAPEPSAEPELAPEDAFIEVFDEDLETEEAAVADEDAE